MTCCIGEHRCNSVCRCPLEGLCVLPLLRKKPLNGYVSKAGQRPRGRTAPIVGQTGDLLQALLQLGQTHRRITKMRNESTRIEYSHCMGELVNHTVKQYPPKVRASCHSSKAVKWQQVWLDSALVGRTVPIDGRTGADCWTMWWIGRARHSFVR